MMISAPRPHMFLLVCFFSLFFVLFHLKGEQNMERHGNELFTDKKLRLWRIVLLLIASIIGVGLLFALAVIACSKWII